MADPFIGEIKLVAFTYAPKGWAFAWGQTLAINQNQALFALLGTTYGGNGTTTFQLPDLRDRVVVSSGQANGLSNYDLGQVGGEFAHVLSFNEMPSHNHALGVVAQPGNTAIPSGSRLATSPLALGFAAHPSANSAMDPNTISSLGGGQPHDNFMPYLCLNYIIALVGIFPSRN